MSSESAITLYDSASRSGKACGWNAVILKIRYALNLKKLPHTIVMLEYPDIETTLRGIGASPTGTKPDGSPHYTMPVIVDHLNRTSSGGPTVVSNSRTIAEYLDTAYPDRPLLFPHGTKTLQRVFHDQFWMKLFRPCSRILVPIAFEFLNDRSRPYWRQTREAQLGEKLEDMCPQGTAKCEERWSVVEKEFAVLATLITDNERNAGGFVMGNQISWADLMILSILQSLFVLAPEDWEKRVKHWNGGLWERLRNTGVALGYMD